MRLCLLPERRVIEPFAGVPAAIIAAFRIGRHPLERLAKPKLEQDARRIGGDLQAGADLSERSGLFEQLDVDTALPQRQQRRDAADTAAGDEYLQTSHGRALPTSSAVFWAALCRFFFVRQSRSTISSGWSAG